jgi:tripartite-type tricarboxylate transporter receptor subunit TctC
MTIPRRRFLHLALGVAALPQLPQLALADAYPSRPIMVVVPFAPGGPTDFLVRTLGEPMRASLGQPLINENVAGAAGTIGVTRAVRAAPDGYTVSIGHWSTHVINGALYALTFDLLTDLEPIALLTIYPMVLLANNSVPAKDLHELIAWLKTNESKVSVATVGVGSAAHVAGVTFANLTGLDLQYVPYRGGGPAMQDLMGGQVQVYFDHLSNALPQVRGGRVKAYAVTAKTRSPAAPDIPTMDEAGVPGLYVNVWYGLWVPKGTPAEIKARLNAAVRAALADADVRKKLSDLGQVIPPPEQQTPAALAAYQKAEIDKWWPIVKAAHMKGE